MDVICVLPARLHSTRIPRKLLSMIAGRPLIEWSWRAACRVSVFDRVVVATDSEEIGSCAAEFDADVVMTSTDHESGTDRVEEAACRLEASDEDIVVNYQADEPFLDADAVTSAVEALVAGADADVATLAAPIIDEAQWRSPGVVKVARSASGRALYFSRASIPHDRDGAFKGEPAARLRHIGLYAYRRPALRRWAALPPSRLEQLEKLEQLRALEDGMRIHVEIGPPSEAGVDLPADLERAERILTETG